MADRLPSPHRKPLRISRQICSLRGPIFVGAALGLGGFLAIEAALTRSAEAESGGAAAPRNDTQFRFAYGNCDAARAAGADPVYRGEPGYGPHLDRDNDGVGCEPYPR